MIKYILSFIITLNCYALDVNISLFNIHHFAKSDLFKNKITKQGEIITNPLISIGYKHFVMIGKDSINSPIIGYYYSSNNLMFGAYTNSYKKWSKIDLNRVYIHINNDLDIIPIIGYKDAIKLNKDVSLTYIITPVLTNLSLTFTF